MAGGQHWTTWDAAYDEPDSSLAARLPIVQRRLREALESAPPGPIRLISICAGQGRDVLGVLADHSRRDDVSARLVELDPGLVRAARAVVAAIGLSGIEVVEGDASDTSRYAGAVPAQVAMVCGVFGNVSGEDIQATVAELPRLCGPGATVIWTRHRRPPDLTPSIRAWFDQTGFDEVGFDTVPGRLFSVGTNRLAGEPLAFRPGRRMFQFFGDGAEAHH